MTTVAGQLVNRRRYLISLNCCELRHSDSFSRYGPGWAMYGPPFFNNAHKTETVRPRRRQLLWRDGSERRRSRWNHAR